MKTTLTAAAFLLGASMPAFAQTMTIEFAPDDGSDALAITFDQSNGKATMPDGSVQDYTWDEATATICSTPPEAEGEVCATFADGASEPSIGLTSAYTTNVGGAGSATITAMSE